MGVCVYVTFMYVKHTHNIGDVLVGGNIKKNWLTSSFSFDNCVADIDSFRVF